MAGQLRDMDDEVGLMECLQLILLVAFCKSLSVFLRDIDAV